MPLRNAFYHKNDLILYNLEFINEVLIIINLLKKKNRNLEKLTICCYDVDTHIMFWGNIIILY